MKKSNYSKILSMILALVMVVSLTPLAAVHAFADSDTVVDNPNGHDYLVVDGSDSYPLFNSGATSSSGRQYSTSGGGDYNPNSHSQKNSGYDIYGESPFGRDLTLGLGLSFYVQSEVTENATLTIYAYDIDEERSQIDEVYLVNDNTGVRYNVGYLSGRDETWSTSTFTIAADYFEVGETYHFEVDVCEGGWWTWVRSVSVQLTCGEYVPTVIEEHAFTAYISQDGYVYTSLYLKTNQNITYNLEYTANIGQEQKGGYEGSSISANSNGVNAYDGFYLETGSPVGSYVITVVLKDANGNTVTSYSYTAGYEYSAVTYDSNGGSNNLPIDTNAYGSGETVYVSFDTIPSRAGYTFLGWASDRNATVPEFEANGITSFVIGDVDVILYAVWQENPVEPPIDPDEPIEADVWDGTVANGFGGGSGTESDPYLIYTAEELAYLAQSTNAGTSYSGYYFKLMNNIDLNNIEWTPIGKGTATTSQNTSLSFSGNFEGNYCNIYNLKISNNATSYTGIFGICSGKITNLGVVNTDISIVTSTEHSVGSIAGYLYGGEISNCYALNVSILSKSSEASKSGGIVGLMDGSAYVNNCYATGYVGGNGYTGGIVGAIFGTNAGGTVNNAYFVGELENTGATGSGYITPQIGGIGSPMGGYNTSFHNSFFVGEMSSVVSGIYMGGINGDDRGTSYNCYYSSSTSFNRYEGTSTLASNFASQSWVESNLGWDFGSTWTYKTGYDYPVLQGFGYGAIVEPPIDPPVEPPIDPDEPIEADVWDGTVANGFGGGSGTEYDPYLIYTAEELAYLAQSVNAGTTYSGKYFKLMNNIDLNNIEWTPIGKGIRTEEYERVSYSFGGHFDGNNYVVYNLLIANNDTSYNGLFGVVYSGSISNLGIENAYVYSYMNDGKRTNNGALVGSLQGSTVSHCYVIGADIHSYSTSQPANAGMLIGNLGESACYIDNCFAYGSATTGASAGGLIGSVYISSYTISNCYAIGTVKYVLQVSDDPAFDEIGGLVGWTSSKGSVNNCFFVGSIESNYSPTDVYTLGNINTTNCYYNITSSVIDDYRGTSTDAANFSNQSWVESNLGWDFGSIWTYKTGYDYPVLQGFGNAGIVPNPHQHSFTEEYVEASCSSYGYTVYTCSCGYSYNDNYYILPHTPGDWIIDYEATCTTSGRKHTECIYCGQVFENIYIPAPGHTYISEVIRETTCEEYGIIQHTCVNCGDNYLTYVYSEHSYYVSERVEATCESDGYILYTCNNCSDSYTEVIPGGHDYVATITRVATADTDGEVLYTCSICGDSYTEIIPARPDANVLLIQDRWPWDENNNVTLLNKMLEDGYITGWDLTTTTNFGNVNLAGYNVILIANDQSSGTYNQLGALQDTLIQFANAGGVVIYGACDHGWAAGDISYTLPEGVSKTNYYSRYNYIVDADHPIVTGIYTDGKSINNNLLNGNYCSHTGFQNLPAGANVILQDAHGTPTLAEYAVGDGHIILSGLTWEFYYYRNCYDGRTNTSYTKNVYDDLIVYALYLSDPCEHAYDEGEIVDPTCVDNGYTLHTCELCGAYYKDNFVDPTGHVPGEWVVELEPTADEEGRKILSCTVCNEVLMSEVIPIINAPVVNIYAATNPVIIGQTFEVYVMVEGCDPVKSMAMTPMFDSDIFELVSKEWLVDATMRVIEPEIAAAWMNETNINTTLFKFVFRANQLTDGSLITADVLVQNNGVIRLSVVGSNVAVIECPHTNCTVSTIDADHHLAVCDVCGFATISAHAFDGVCDAICDDCGYERVAPHSYSESWTLDENGHWHVCDLCGAIDAVIDHVYADEHDMYCDDCGYQRFILGDVNADGYVDSDDAVHLLMHTYYPDDYTVNQPCDFDNDSDVDSDDAIRILMYVFFGEVEYPLTH